MINLKQIRSSSNMSQELLANKMGVSRTTVTMWETGGSQPDHDSLIRLSDFFNVSIDYLIGHERSVTYIKHRNPVVMLKILYNIPTQVMATIANCSFKDMEKESISFGNLSEDEYKKICIFFELNYSKFKENQMPLSINETVFEKSLKMTLDRFPNYFKNYTNFSQLTDFQKTTLQNLINFNEEKQNRLLGYMDCLANTDEQSLFEADRKAYTENNALPFAAANGDTTNFCELQTAYDKKKSSDK